MVDTGCPCGSGKGYRECCGRFHAGETAAPTAEALMRSRFSAYAKGDTAYLLQTWAAATRPQRLDLDRKTRWTELEIVETTGGSAIHTEGTVRFRAHYAERGQAGVMEEHSTFARENGRWVYVAAL
ncbi:YchJ family protein [Herbidospora mongoliensis]|uniref:YchJ family protein n=1 Tax=Herbidospora mongoliensis TaxID=688067 RepID=UPI0023BA3987|nr:YchJ family protein [Herbidospora mongoliensis]